MMEEVYLEIEAGSTGKPNRAAELANIARELRQATLSGVLRTGHCLYTPCACVGTYSEEIEILVDSERHNSSRDRHVLVLSYAMS